MNFDVINSVNERRHCDNILRSYVRVTLKLNLTYLESGSPAEIKIHT